MDELDTFLDGKPTDAPAEPVAAEPEGPARDEHGRFAPKEKGVETPPQPEAQPEVSAEPVPPTEPGKLPQDVYEPLRAVREENKTLKAQIEALQNQFQSLQQPQDTALPPDLFEDTQGWQQHFGSQVAQQAAFNAKLDMSEMLARQNNTDFDEMKTKFLEMAQANPGVAKQALDDPHPWAKAYTIAKNAAKMEALGAVDVAELEAKIREQVTAELATKQPAPNLPTSLADQQSSRVAATAPAAPLTLEDILGT